MKRFRNILLIVDTDADNSAALKRAVSLANNNQAALCVCTVADAVATNAETANATITPAELGDIVVAEQGDRLDRLVKTLAVEDAVSISTTVLVGRPFIEIIRQVLRSGHDLVVKCAESATGLQEMLFGSTDMHLMRKCPCPVWIIRSTEQAQYRRILAAVDQDPQEAVKSVLNRQILEMSTSLALADFSELHIVHAWRLEHEGLLRSARVGNTNAEVDAIVDEEAEDRRQWLKRLVETYGNKADKTAVDYLEPQLHVIKGDARHVVPTTAQELDTDLIVMGTVARTGVAGFFMGNTAESILTQLDCSVLTVKPSGFVSPVTLAA